ncbi:MAG: DNA-binding response regulator [Elusimicrobia bacterium RIFOXYA12_FULL_51_18]|nr:MAG: DNA-binding response regulator [Elusimicrobia bacterium RIFOXYA12_FULL_51_18]OGS32412.1 MAG: DNA-binding response regulator [Elusimicrobia bacterium RIFOXYA2_FULL_53_38]
MEKKILICDDHKIFREGLRALLEKQPGIKVIGEARDGIESVRLAKELSPDIVIMDISMPGLNGIEASRKLAKTRKAARIIALSMHNDRKYVTEIFKAGARAYLLKDSAFEELLDAIKAVNCGRFFLSAGITSLVLSDYIKGPAGDPRSPFTILSAREREVLQLLAEGLRTKEISHKLDLSVKTVETHRKKIMEKIGITSIAGLTRYAVKEGLVSL